MLLQAFETLLLAGEALRDTFGKTGDDGRQALEAVDGAIEPLLDSCQPLILRHQLPGDATAQVADVAHQDGDALFEQADARGQLLDLRAHAAEPEAHDLRQVDIDGFEISHALIQGLGDHCLAPSRLKTMARGLQTTLLFLLCSWH